MLNHSFTVKYITSRNCFLALSEANIRKLSYNKIVRLQFGSKELYFSCVQSARINDNNILGFPSTLGKLIGIAENESVYLNDVLRLPILGEITISPLSFEDYEILQTASDRVQETMLDQVRVLNKNQKVIIWISKWLYASVRIDDADSMQSGVLANLTEVHINHPYNSKPNYSNNINKENIKSEMNSVVISDEKIIPEVNDTSIELNVLNKYLNIKKPTVFRVHPLYLPQNLVKSDSIIAQPFNVFIYKKDLPSFIKTENYNEVLLCNLSKINPPIDYRESKEENNILKTDLIVRICVIEEYINLFSNETQELFTENTICRKYPIIFVTEKTMSTFNILIGSKVSLGNNFPPQSNIISVELSLPNKKTKNIIQIFKTFIADQVKHGKCLINSNFCIEVQPNVVCSLTFNPESEFCLFDEHLLRNVQISENTDKKVVHDKVDICTTLIDSKELYNDCDNFNKILKRAQKMLCLRNSNENVFIVGKPGSGKTTLSKQICQNLLEKPMFMHIVYISCKKLKGKTMETLYKLFSQDFQNMIYYQPSILVLDDLHIICGKSEAATEVQTQESLYFSRVSEMLSELIEMCQKSNKISVIATCESTMKINDNLLSPRGKHLFKNIFSIPELSKKEREAILNNLFLKKAQIETDIDFDDLSVKTEGFVIQDLVDFTTKSVFESVKRDSKNNQSKPIISPTDIETAYKNSVTLALRDVRLHSPGDKNFKDVGGLEDVKKVLVESMRWPAQYPGLFENAPLRLQSGMLLYGPPGVGKTLLVGATARQCGLRLITVKGPELLSKYVGASEQAVRGIFEKAQSARPCILFFDEFDSLAPRRGHDSTGVTDRVVNQLLTQLDGVESLTGVFVIAATSRPDLLDPALLRPGRLDRQLLCSVPEQTARMAILKALSRNLVLAKEVDLKKVTVGTKGFSGADLQAVLYTAQLFAVEEMLASGKAVNSEAGQVTITGRHMEEALRNTRPSLTKQEAHKYDKIYAKFQGKKEEVDVAIKKQRATLA